MKGAPEGQASQVLGTTMFSGRTSALLPWTSKAGRQPGSTGHHLGLHSGGDR